REAMAVDVAYDGAAAVERLTVNDYDVVVLDRDLPAVSGDAVCTTLVEAGADTRILMLTAAAAVAQRVAGLGLGADDYLTKPFAFAELVARAQALGRRARPAGRSGSGRASASIRTATPSRGMAGRWRCPETSSRCWPSSCARGAASCRPSSSWSAPGTSTPTRSPAWSGIRS